MITSKNPKVINDAGTFPVVCFLFCTCLYCTARGDTTAMILISDLFLFLSFSFFP